MSTNVSNLALNKKGTKVKITGVPKMYGLLGTVIQWGPSFAYLSIQFDLFTFKNEGYAITGWGVVFAIALFLAFRQKISDKLKEYETMFGSSWNRARGGSIALGIATVLFLVSIFSTSLFIIFFIYSGSTYLSLFAYNPYDEINKKRIEMQELLDKDNKEKDFATLTKQFNEMNA